jgi:hypothetical protein
LRLQNGGGAKLPHHEGRKNPKSRCIKLKNIYIYISYLHGVLAGATKSELNVG